MSRKKIYEDPFEAPPSEKILEVVNSLGGKATVCRMLKKNWSTIDRWCRGTVKIDYANWEFINEAIREKIEREERCNC